jgi:hypothetical protein
LMVCISYLNMKILFNSDKKKNDKAVIGSLSSLVGILDG